MPNEDPPAGHPATFRLPRAGRWKAVPHSKKEERIYIPSEVDREFGFTRSFYYQLEERGILELIRITQPGSTKGITLVPYLPVWRYVQSQIAKRKKAA